MYISANSRKPLWRKNVLTGKVRKQKFRKLPTNINEGSQNYNISYNLPDETQGNSCLNVVDKQIVFLYLQRSNKKLPVE